MPLLLLQVQVPLPMSFLYRSYSQFARDIRAWLRHVPPIAAVAGIPRSGVIAAAIIAMERHIPLVEIGDWRGWRYSEARKLAEDRGEPVLVVDDTSWNGGTIEAAKTAFHEDGILWGAVYIHERMAPRLDCWGYQLPTPHHTFEWNLFRDVVTRKLAVDIDGVICDEEPGGNHGGYLAPCRQQIHALVTGRPERHRAETESWLKAGGIDFRHLYMLPNQFIGRPGQVARFKASVFRTLYRQGRVVAFVESCPQQAREIAGRTSLPVLCYQTHEAHNQSKPRPSWS